MNLISAWPAGVGGRAVFRDDFIKPALSPPAWLFSPIWFFLNITSLWALAIVVNRAGASPRRKAFLLLEAIGWLLYASFTTLYFWLHSPVLGAIDTVAGLAVGLASLASAAGLSGRAAGLILLRVLWLALASYVSLAVALRNPDPFFTTMGW